MKSLLVVTLAVVVSGAGSFVAALPGENSGPREPINDSGDPFTRDPSDGSTLPAVPKNYTPPAADPPPPDPTVTAAPPRRRAVQPPPPDPSAPPATPPSNGGGGLPTVQLPPSPDLIPALPLPTLGQKSPRNQKPPTPDPVDPATPPTGGSAGGNDGGPIAGSPIQGQGATGGPAHGGRTGWNGLGAGSNGGAGLSPEAAAAAVAAQREADARELSKSVGSIDNSSADVRRAQHAAGLVHASRSKLDMGDPEGALRDASAALALEPNSSSALTLRASALNALKRYDEAGRDALVALKLGVDNEQAPAENLAWSQLMRGDYVGAVESANRALKANPKSALALATRAYAEQMLGRYEDMKRDIAAAAALDSRFATQAALAAAGKMIFNPNGTDASYLLGAAAAATALGGAGGALPWILGLLTLAAIAALAALAAFTYLRTRRGSPRLAALRPSRSGEERLVGGKYRLEGIIGRGGMGEVRRAKDVTLQRPVAVKTLVADLAGAGDEWRQKLRAEAMTVAGVHHPNIVDIYEIVEEDGVLHLIFEYVEGQTVHGVLATRGRLNASDCARILAPVCAALELAHSRGLVHRDLKPANIMLTESGHVKLMDFGIARPVGQRVQREDGKAAAGLLFDRTTSVVGTPVYMAPEAERGLVGPACDVYSLGACLYEMLTGTRPFRADATAYDKMELIPPRPSALAPGVPDAVDRLVAAALSPDPAARPTVGEFARLLVDGARTGKDGLTPSGPHPVPN